MRRLLVVATCIGVIFFIPSTAPAGTRPKIGCRIVDWEHEYEDTWTVIVRFKNESRHHKTIEGTWRVQGSLAFWVRAGVRPESVRFKSKTVNLRGDSPGDVHLDKCYVVQ